MPILIEKTLDKGLLVLWKISEDLETLIKLCSDFGIEDELLKLRNPRRKKEWLAVRLLLKHINCSSISVRYNSKSQPIILHPKYKHISISHSGEIAGIILHEDKLVGLDIENINRDFKKVQHKYLSTSELELASTLTDGLALFWCAKEAIYKVLGIEGVDFAKQLAIHEIDNKSIQAAYRSDNQAINFTLNFFYQENQLIVYLIDTENKAH